MSTTATMATAAGRPLSPPPAAPKGGAPKGSGGNASLTGFVLKLCNMVNGAPDDVVSWVPSGEAFRISNLARLEAETLPQYFRHSRFQSLVRQLNFYNFRKINRERTFWVYYHPLFHRDRPEEMHKLRRRTCPGFDGRRNRPNQDVSPPPPSSSITWSNNEVVHERHHPEEMEEGGARPHPQAMLTSPHGAGVKVSRSPSPSSSPMDHLPAGRGSYHSYGYAHDGHARDGHAHGGGPPPPLESVISEEERGDYVRQTSLASASSDHYGTHYSAMEGERDYKDYHRAEGEDAGADAHRARGRAPTRPPADPPREEEEIVVDQLSCHLDGPNHQAPDDRGPAATASTTFTKKSRKAKIWNLDNDRSDKKCSKEELQERQRHLKVVADVSRRLEGICADHATSVLERKPRRGKGGRGRPGASDDVTIPAQMIPVFGLDKPHNHYYGAGKCDLFTYDCDEGFVVDDQDCGHDGFEKKERDAPAESRSPGEPREEAIATPPSSCPLANRSLVRACAEGRLSDAPAGGGSRLERALAPSMLSFCLSTHPRDPLLYVKISSLLREKPALAGEFRAYREALAPGSDPGMKPAFQTDDLKRDWRTFALNFFGRVVPPRGARGGLSAAEEEALDGCVACWSRYR